MKEFFCEAEDHDGWDRRIRWPSDQVLMTLDFMSADGKTRLARVGPHGQRGGLRLCKPCALHKIDKLRGVDRNQEVLFRAEDP